MQFRWVKRSISDKDGIRAPRPIRFKTRRSSNVFHQLYNHLFQRPMPKLRLSHQLIGFFVFVVLVPLLIVTFIIFGINQKAVKKQIAEFTENTAEVTYDELASEMGWQARQAHMATDYLKTAVPPSSDLVFLTTRFLTNNPDYYAIGFYSSSGRLLSRYTAPNAYVPVDVFPAQIAPAQPLLQYNLRFENPDTSPRPDMPYHLLMTMPLEGDINGNAFKMKKEAVAQIRFFKPFPFMVKLVNDRYRAFQTGFVIVDAKGNIIAGPPQLVSQRLTQHDWERYSSLKVGVAREFTTERALYGVRPKNGADESPRLQKVFMKLSDPAWGLIFESPYEVQQFNILRARAQSLLLIFGCILLIVILGMLYASGINRNFRQMIKGIKALAEGRYSRKIRLITKTWTPYEIVYLTAEFNRMATKISTAWSSIQKLNQELVFKNDQDLFIAKATQRLHSSLELSAVCQTATDVLVERENIQAALLYLNHPDDQPLGKPASLAINAKADTAFSTMDLNAQAAPYIDSVFQQNRTLVISAEMPGLTSETQSQSGLLQNEPASDAAQCYLQFLPITYQGHSLGVLVLFKSQAFTTPALLYDDALLTDLLGNQIGVAVYQARQWQELQQANVQLSELDELKSNLIDTVSHELRTPLTNIKGYTSRLIRNEKTLDSETKIQSLKVIKRQTDRLTRLVEDLLVIPEIEGAGGLRVYPDRVDLSDILYRNVGFIQEKSQREIQVIHCPENVDILVDPDRIEQVLVNVLDNAVKYSTEDGRIEVKSYVLNDNTVRIEVFNPCEPIPAADLHQLFSKFKRLDERLTRTTRGTGLGLYITKGLVEAMSGRIWLESDPGFTVLIEVPVFNSNATDAAPEPSNMM